MHLYLSIQFISSDGILKAVELVVIENNKIHTRIIHSKNFYTIAIDYPNYLTDFDVSLVGNYVDHLVPVVDVLCNDADLPEEGVFSKDPIISLHAIFERLAKSGALYIPTFLDLSKVDGYMGPVPSFRELRVSASTMTIGISAFDTNRGSWITESLVSNKKGTSLISQNDFIVAIEESKMKDFFDIGLIKLSKVMINNIVYVLCKYIAYSYSIFDGIGSFCSPAIPHFCHMEFITKNMIRLLEDVMGRFLPVIAEKNTHVEKSRSFAYEKDNGFFFRLKAKSLTIDECSTHVNSIITLVRESNESGIVIDSKIITNYLNFMKCDLGLLPVFSTLVKLMFNEDSNLIDEPDVYRGALEYFKLTLLSYQLTLYNLRVAGMYYPKLVMYPEMFKRFEVYGSIFKRTVVVERRI